MHEVKLTDGTIWKRNNYQLLIDKLFTPSNNSVSLSLSKIIDENVENASNIPKSHHFKNR